MHEMGMKENFYIIEKFDLKKKAGIILERKNQPVCCKQASSREGRGLQPERRAEPWSPHPEGQPDWGRSGSFASRSAAASRGGPEKMINAFQKSRFFSSSLNLISKL